jgi:hypothetical protein
MTFQGCEDFRPQDISGGRLARLQIFARVFGHFAHLNLIMDKIMEYLALRYDL